MKPIILTPLEAVFATIALSDAVNAARQALLAAKNDDAQDWFVSQAAETVRIAESARAKIEAMLSAAPLPPPLNGMCPDCGKLLGHGHECHDESTGDVKQK